MLTYVYDGEGRICAGKEGSLMMGYLYDAEGHRVAKGSVTSIASCDPTVNGFVANTYYIVGKDGEEVSVTDGSGNWQHTNVYANGELLATITPTDTRFALHDWLGTKRVELGASGCGTPWVQYPYGDGMVSNTILIAGVALPQCSSDASGIHFTGKERDTESGLDYFGARYYGSSMGRFMSPDWSVKAEPVPYAKLEDPQSLNLYAYARNNPLSKIDIDGHEDVAADCKGKQNCNVTVNQTLNLIGKDGKVSASLSVSTKFSVTSDDKGNITNVSASSTVQNGTGHQFSDSQLAAMGSTIGAIQQAGVTMGFGANTTELLTAFAAKETVMGTYPNPGAPDFKQSFVNPLQLSCSSGQCATLNRGSNIQGALDDLDRKGSRFDFEPRATYQHYSGQPSGVIDVFMKEYNSIHETTQPH